MKQSRYPHYYYVDGGVKTISLTAQTLSGQVVRTGAIDVQRPDYLMNSRFGDVRITTLPNKVGEEIPSYVFGSDAIPGIELTFYPLAPNYPGTATYTQLIDASIIVASNAISGTVVRREAMDDGGGILDADLWINYNTKLLDSPLGPLELNLVNLVPPIYLFSNNLSRDDYFTTYLQWQSNKAQSIRVPIRYYSWFWRTGISRPVNGEVYEKDYEFNSSNGFAVGTTTTDHPEWTKQIKLDFDYEYDQ